MEYEFSDKAVEAAIDAIRDIDETASRGFWKWDQTFEGRQDRIVNAFVQALPTVEADDLANEAMWGGKIRRYHGKAYALDILLRKHLAPFFRSIEDLVNQVEEAA